MDFKSKFSEQPTVDISVLKVKGKKVTKSILNQIAITKSYLPDSQFFNDVQIVGYVQSNDRFPWMLVEKEGRLLKSSLDLLFKLLQAKTVNAAYDFLDIELGAEVDFYADISTLPEEHLRTFQHLQDKARHQLTILKSHQIYI